MIPIFRLEDKGGRGGSKGILGEGVQSGDIFGLEGASLKKITLYKFFYAI